MNDLPDGGGMKDLEYLSPYERGLETILVLRDKQCSRTIFFYNHHQGGPADYLFGQLTGPEPESYWEKWHILPFYDNPRFYIECYTLHEDHWVRDYTTNPDAPLLSSGPLNLKMQLIVLGRPPDPHLWVPKPRKVRG